MGKQIRLYLLLFIVLFSFSCEKDNIDPVFEDKDTLGEKENPIEKEVPEGSRKVLIKVDPKYDLSNTIAYSLKDSVALNASDKALAVPNGSKDYAIFLDKNTDNIVAIIGIDSISNEAVVNAKTVTASMHDLIPNYLTLSESNRKDFDATAPKLPEYNNFVSMVDELLTNKQSIYSTDEKFIEQLLLLNSHITEKYYDNFADESGRIASDSDKDIKLWLVKNTAPGVTNQVYSHVDATFTPSLIDVGPAAKTYAVNPRPLPGKGLNKPSSIPLKDGYYEVEISQKTPQAQTNNEKALAQGAINVIFGFLSGQLTGSDTQKCTAAMTLSIHSDLLQEMLSPPTDWQSAALTVVKIGVNTFEKFIKSESCLRAFVNPNIILKNVVGHSNVYSATFKYVKSAIEIAELGPWIVGRWIDPIEYNTQMQVHYGKVIPGTIGFMESEEEKLLESYKAGKVINPVVQAQILSSYDDVVFTNYAFKVKWVVDEGHGTIKEETSFDQLGKSSSSWKLPLVKGKYKATAYIFSRSGDLLGSPVKFETTVEENLTYFIATINGEIWESYDQHGGATHWSYTSPQTYGRHFWARKKFPVLPGEITYFYLYFITTFNKYDLEVGTYIFDFHQQKRPPTFLPLVQPNISIKGIDSYTPMLEFTEDSHFTITSNKDGYIEGNFEFIGIRNNKVLYTVKDGKFRFKHPDNWIKY